MRKNDFWLILFLVILALGSYFSSDPTPPPRIKSWW